MPSCMCVCAAAAVPHKNLFIFYFLHTYFNMIIKTFSHQCNNITEKCQRNLVLLSSVDVLASCAAVREREAHARAHHTHTLGLQQPFHRNSMCTFFSPQFACTLAARLVASSCVLCCHRFFVWAARNARLTNARAHTKISSLFSHMCYKRLMHLRNAMQPFLFCGTSVAAAAKHQRFNARWKKYVQCLDVSGVVAPGIESNKRQRTNERVGENAHHHCVQIKSLGLNGQMMILKLAHRRWCCFRFWRVKWLKNFKSHRKLERHFSKSPLCRASNDLYLTRFVCHFDVCLCLCALVAGV